MKKLSLALLALLAIGCASPQEACSKTGIAEEYGGYDQCVAAKTAKRRAVAAAFDQSAKQSQQRVDEIRNQKSVDSNCTQNCQASGLAPGLCQSKCSY